MMQRREIEITQPIRFSELPTKERRKQAEKDGGIKITLNRLTGQEVARVKVQRPIDYFFETGFIEDYHFHAASELNSDYGRKDSYIPPIRSCLNTDHGIASNSEIEHYIARAKERFIACMGQLDSTEKVLIERLVFDEGYQRDLKGNWKGGYGMLTPLIAESLRDALEKVAEFYGFIFKRK